MYHFVICDDDLTQQQVNENLLKQWAVRFTKT